MDERKTRALTGRSKANITTRKFYVPPTALGSKRLTELQLLLVPTSEFISVKLSERIAMFCEQIYIF
jgi:hypothetical protein